ncbi:MULTISPECIES: lytic transglycosylase domain-containing protein [Catenuloplanes]|uniref:Membrane-bound lytic murein transglycosylase B n=1 Tax=Catenuloplanes niger TaxID=587534 RepID=A0AAE3ZR46_9ACTN|nr:murein transglycosylase [Catenuloplanes niger]MDR7324091.1 hypothetical protein [Catenuloplanes niger]
MTPATTGSPRPRPSAEPPAPAAPAAKERPSGSPAPDRRTTAASAASAASGDAASAEAASADPARGATPAATAGSAAAVTPRTGDGASPDKAAERGTDAKPSTAAGGAAGDPGATKTDLPPVAQPALAGGAALGLARLTRRRLRPPTAPRHAAVPLNPLLRRFPAVHGMAQRSLDGAAAWRRGRWGRLTLPGLLFLALLGAAGTAGGVLVPAAAGNRATEPPPAATPTPGAADTGLPVPATDAPLPPLVTDLPVAPTGSATPTAPVPGARPADALAAWAQQVGAKVDIPPVALQAYGYAEWVVGQRQPNCHLNWTTLAAIGRVESNHGRANGAALLPDGESNPPIYGLPLDGQGDRKLIPDTDQGRLDSDTTYDRAIGSMQFIPTTWALWKIDADNDGVTDPNDIDDAALAAGNYLCANDKDLSTTEDWWNAILTYNNVEPYAQSVYEAANDFGLRSQT